MPELTWPRIAPWVMLLGSNLFMTFAWYWHLKFKTVPIMIVVAISWGLALFEYLIAVPANRIGSSAYSGAQLKTIQEVITLVVFVIFSVTYLGEPLKWSTLTGFALILCGAGLVFMGKF